MRARALLTAGFGALTLVACGGSAEEPPVEQIVVREPGEVAPAVENEESIDLVAAGQRAFAMCTGCHVAGVGEASMAGPNLYGVVGRVAGSLDDFAYSEALAGSGITWTDGELDAFLANPTSKVAGTSMVAGAVSNDENRAAIIAYLGSLSE